MRKKLVKIVTIAAAFTMMAALAGCNKKNATPESTSTLILTPPTEFNSEVADPANVTDPVNTTDPVSASGRADGERYETTIILEGMEETVGYEHVKNDAIGYEMGYEYDSLTRISKTDSDRYVSIYDDEAKPMNYLEIAYQNLPVDIVTTNIRMTLSETYDIETSTRTLDNIGDVTFIDASAKNGEMLDEIQGVYIIPAGSGTIVATGHYEIEAAEGFGRRFRYMLNTLIITK